MSQLELFEIEPKKSTTILVIGGVYQYVDETLEDTQEMCVHLGNRQTVWFGRNQEAGSFYSILEHATNFDELTLCDQITFGVSIRSIYITASDVS